MKLKNLKLNIIETSQILLLFGKKREVLSRYEEDGGYISNQGTYIPDEEVPNLKVVLVQYFPGHIQITVEKE